jgi:uncharacterized protein (TIGR01589 family)
MGYSQVSALCLEPDKPAKIGLADVEKVHYLVETCLLRNLNMVQTSKVLQRFGVPCRLTILVWCQLERENPEFFEQYWARRAQQGDENF